MGVYACYDRICIDYHLYDGMSVLLLLFSDLLYNVVHSLFKKIGFGVFTCY